MKRLFFLLFALITASLSYGQEICDNGVDDDADGLVDMNDPDCDCNGLSTGGGTSVTSLIPNPSFENNSCCPSSVSQLYCADNWIQASNATSDYFNTCGYTGIFNSPNLPLPGGGSGYAGFYSNSNWEENIGACLTAPMTAGTSYTMDFNTAWSTGSQTLELTLYGTPNCGDLPWNTSTCAPGSGGWMVLGSVTVNYPANQSWQQVQITFTPPVDIYAVSIGGPCGGQQAGSNYYFVDELTLATSSSFNPGFAITETGNWCNNDLELNASIDTVGGTWQWYEDGVALAGETDSIINMMTYGAGNFTAVYTVGGECETSDYTLTIPGAPTADFNFTNQCDGIPIAFTDNSTVTAPAVITNYDWDFGDGNTSTTQSPNHSYGSDGTYNVSLTVTDDNGCQNTMNQNVTVYPNPQTDFEFLINGVSSTTGLTGGCLIDQVNFQNNSAINAPDNIATWAWDFGDGNTSNAQNPPPHTYATDGNYVLTLNTTSNNGCPGTFNMPITIHPSPVADFTVPDDCIDVDAVFTNNSSITSGTITTHEWDFGDGNTSATQSPTHAYGSDGTYNVELVVISDQGCTDTLTGTTTQFPEPVADFTMTSECIVTASTIVNNSSVNAPDNIAIWAWDFDDGNTSAAQNPGTHTFAVENTYNVQLAVETNNGCQDTLIVPVTVNPSPVADFTVVDNCVNVAASFTNNSLISSGSIATYEWDFGDGNTSAAQQPTHPYAADGTYTVELVVISDLGCTDTISTTTDRHPIPNPSFTVSDVCVYDAITVNETSTINPPDVITSWDWDLGDGNTGTGATANHTYAAEGTYTIDMVATSSNGCSANVSQPVTIHGQPIPDFTATSVCINTPPTVFTDNSSVPGGAIASWNWNLGDGSTANGQGITHTYGTDGVYLAQLLVTSTFGCVDSISKNVTVYEKPTASFFSDKNVICSPDRIIFTDNSMTGTAALTNWEWNFFGGTGSANGTPVEVVYENNTSTPVDYDAELIVTNIHGCSDTVLYSNYITVYPTPEARFTANPNTLTIMEAETQFNNGSVNSDQWEWNFGDGSIGSVQENPSHLYPQDEPGLYNVQLIAYNYGQTCSDTANLLIEVEDVIIFYVPNIFTPDGDEFNETWKPIFFSGHDPYDFHLMIFNRWGELIWESYDATAGWNGHYGDGGLVDDGTFIWQLDFKETMSDKRHNHRGHVTVLK